MMNIVDKEILDMLKEFNQEFKTINVKLDGLEYIKGGNAIVIQAYVFR